MKIRLFATFLIGFVLCFFSYAEARPYNLKEGVQDLVGKITQSMQDKSKKKLAVMEFANLDGSVSNFGKYLSEKMITEMFSSGRFKVVERRQLNKVLKELNFGRTDVVDQNTSKELGRLLGVDAVGIGSVTDLGQTVEVNAKLIEIETAEVFAVASTEFQENDAIKRLMGQVSRPTSSLGSFNQPGESLKDPDVGEMVYVSDYGFHIDKYEVTNAQYAEFVRATGHRAPDCADYGRDDWNTWLGNRPPSGQENHPVVGVSWDDAKAYCGWAGKRLPTEQEWQQACQGKDGRRYPWGSSFVSGNANISGSEDGYAQTAPVGTYPGGASPYGAMDMSGNVWEWTSSLYKGVGSRRVLHGGSWHKAPGLSFLVRCSNRYNAHPEFRSSGNGFRCARAE